MTNPFLPNQRKFFTDAEFIEGANTLLRDEIYPAMHEEARLLMHSGRPCLLRHIVDNHLLHDDSDPVGLKMFVGPVGMDRHQFEHEHGNREFLHPDYYAVIADPKRKTIRLDYHLGGFGGDIITFYQNNINEFDTSQVKAGFGHFCKLLS